jgi:hypothetical protein
MESIRATIFQEISEITRDTNPKNADLEHTERLIGPIMENFYEYLNIDSKEGMNRTTINDISGEEYKKLVKNLQELKKLKERVRVSFYGHINRHDLYDEWYEEMDMAVNNVSEDD